MLSFTVDAALDEIDLLIKRGKSILLMPRYMAPQVEIVLRSESEWVREAYDTLTLVFQRSSEADMLLGTGPCHPCGVLSTEIGDFEQRMRNRLNLLAQLRDTVDKGSTRKPRALAR